ncbi:MIP family Ig-specific serine endopeptidase [Mycoplasmopsis agassizii]|uniref:MIP family Ig-specific serine endopeptidase n=1 Tax=Mycoplasmopsis agassizii TaxID=33922 RepID=UPI0035297C81
MNKKLLLKMTTLSLFPLASAVLVACANEPKPEPVNKDKDVAIAWYKEISATNSASTTIKINTATSITTIDANSFATKLKVAPEGFTVNFSIVANSANDQEGTLKVKFVLTKASKFFNIDGETKTSVSEATGKEITLSGFKKVDLSTLNADQKTAVEWYKKVSETNSASATISASLASSISTINATSFVTSLANTPIGFKVDLKVVNQSANDQEGTLKVKVVLSKGRDFYNQDGTIKTTFDEAHGKEITLRGFKKEIKQDDLRTELNNLLQKTNTFLVKLHEAKATAIFDDLTFNNLGELKKYVYESNSILDSKFKIINVNMTSIDFNKLTFKFNLEGYADQYVINLTGFLVNDKTSATDNLTAEEVKLYLKLNTLFSLDYKISEKFNNTYEGKNNELLNFLKSKFPSFNEAVNKITNANLSLESFTVKGERLVKAKLKLTEGNNSVSYDFDFEFDKDQANPFNPGNPGDTPDLPPNFPPSTGDKLELPPVETAHSALLTEAQVRQNIFDKTFAITFSASSNEDPNSLVYNLPVGTAWLLDYAKHERETNKYTLFLATNAHVAERAYNAFPDTSVEAKQKYSELFYEKNANMKWKGIALGVADKSKIEFKNDNTDISNQVKFVTNVTYSGADTTRYQDIGDTGITKLNTIFVAANFLDEASNSALETQVNEPNGYIKDFAVVSVTVDLSVLEKTEGNPKLLASHIKKAMETLDKEISKYKTETDVPNLYNKNLPFVDVDQASIYLRSKNSKNSINDKYNSVLSHSYPNTRKIYISGYPSDNNIQRYMQNNPQDSDEGMFNFRSFTNGSEVEFLGKKYQGIYTNAWLDNSSLYYGSSGSLAVNEYGLINGIYSVVSASVNINDVSKKGGFTYLVQAGDIHYEPYSGTGAIVYAHNLIDGTNKELYPKQTKSYRQNLQYLIKQKAMTGFSKTALFDKLTEENN